MDQYAAAFEILKCILASLKPEEIVDEQLLIDLSFKLAKAFFKKIELDPDRIAAQAKAQALAEAKEKIAKPEPEPKKP